MKTKNLVTIGIITSGLWLLVQGASDGAVNTVPWSDSFESYTNGMSIDGTNGWGSDTAAGGVVTTDAAVVGLLTNYPGSYPLSAASHSNVLQVTTQVSNVTHSVSGGVVVVDFMAMPDWMTYMPSGDPDMRLAVCVSTNGKLTIWHRDTTVSPATNQWLELANSPDIPTNVWARFTVLQDNSNKMFQVRVNEGTPISDNAGWTAGGAVQNGSWFHMVQTNAAMAELGVVGASTYLDDMMVSKRTLTWSGTNFAESVTNNGAIDNGSPLRITLSVDTFTGTVGDDFVASNKMTVSGLPLNLTAVAQRVSETQVEVRVSGEALAHEALNSTNLVITFADTAFTLGGAWDVTGSQTNAGLTFLDTPSLSYSTSHFYEAITNNGTIDNSTPLLITLANGTFAGALEEDFAANPSKLVVGTPPSGLTAEVLWLSATQLQMKWLGAATQNDVIHNVTNLTLTFQDGAFNTVPASSVFHAATNLSISFIDPSVLTYGATVFSETVANNGALSGTTLSLTNKAFNATNGEDLVLSGKVEASNLPNGLGLQMVRGGAGHEVTLIFAGTATSNALADSILNFGVTFHDNAFVGGNAAGVANYSLSNLQIHFDDPRTLTYSGLVFTELSGGMIDNRQPLTITLAGDTFLGDSGSDFVAAGKITVGGSMPTGLHAEISKDSATQLSIRIMGTAAANASGDSVSDIAFTFQNGAFTGGNASYVVGYQQTGITVAFIDDTGFFNVVPYEEPFETYEAGTLLADTNGWTALIHADAGIVTNDATVTESLGLSSRLPVTGTHTQVLFVQDYIENAIHSEANGRVYLDFMTIPVPMQATPEPSTNMQFAFYVSTNCQLMIWHHDMTGTPGNRWLALTNAGVISTSSWVRFTFTQDYSNNMFQCRVNEGTPIPAAVGWSLPSGGTQPGSWFHMVKTNGTMSAFGIDGVGVGYLDDLTVRTQLPSGFGMNGSSYFIR